MRVLDIAPSHRRTVMLHTAAWLLLGLFGGSVVQQLGFIVRKTGGSPALAAIVVTGPYVASALAVLYVPWLERYPARPLVSVPRIISGALFLLTAACVGPISLAVVAVAALTVHYAGDAFYGRLLGELYPPESRGRSLSLPMLVQAAAVAGMSALAGKALGSSEAAYRWFLPAGAMLGTIGGALVLRLPAGAEAQAPERAGLKAALREVAANRPFLMWTAIYFVTTLGFWVSQAAKPVYFRDMLGFDYWENGVAVGGYSAALCVGCRMWGKLLDRFRSLRTMTVSWLLFGCGVLITAGASSFEWAVVGQCVSGFGMAGNSLAWYPVVLEFAPAGKVDRYMALYMTAFGVRVLMGGCVSGVLMQMGATGSRTALLVASVIMFMGVGGMVALRRRAAPPRE